MRVKDKDYKTVWMQGSSVFMIDQNKLPFQFHIIELKNHKETCVAIKEMNVRGAGAIGAAAGYAMAQAAIESQSTSDALEFVLNAKKEIEATRPTAYNLFFATKRVFAAFHTSIQNAIDEAESIAYEDVNACKMIGAFGNELIKSGVKIETHCNAGWLAFVDYGSALAPIYAARDSGKDVFVYVDETRPRSQGAHLTAWELYNEGIPHAIIPDNAGAWLMSRGEIDLMIVGADRIAANGDVANKIGTLEKAICAKEFGIPFYVAAPSSTFDLSCPSGKDVIIENRSEDEVLFQRGLDSLNVEQIVRTSNPGSGALNPAFDVTPSKYITGIITEKGIINPTPDEIKKAIG